MHQLILKSLVKAHRKLSSEKQVFLSRISELESVASRHASRRNPEILEILGRLKAIRKQIESRP
jgi:hypothetical protein